MSRAGWIAAGVSAGIGLLFLHARSPRRRRASDPKLSELAPEVREQFAELLAQAPGLRIASARRSCAEQRRLYAQGRTAPGPIVTGADGCRSWHVWGRAADLSGASRDTLEKLGEWWEARGGVWGGRFPNVDDPGHFEYHPGLTIAQVCPDPARCDEVVVT